MKDKIKEIALVITVSYTIISLVVGFINANFKNDFSEFINISSMFLWTSIAVIVLYMYPLFDRFPPVLTIVIQYIIAMAAVFILLYIEGLVFNLHVNAYKDVFYSFTIPYIIGAIVFYYETYKDAKKANSLIKKLQRDE